MPLFFLAFFNSILTMGFLRFKSTLSLSGVLCRAKKRKKYTGIFALKTEKTGSGTAELLIRSPFLSSKSPKNHEKRQKDAKKPKKPW